MISELKLHLISLHFTCLAKVWACIETRVKRGAVGLRCVFHKKLHKTLAIFLLHKLISHLEF